MANSNFFITQGEVLMLLVRKDRRKVPEIAKAMGYHPKHLPHLYQMTRLPDTAIEKACEAFGVEKEIFDIGNLMGDVSNLKEENSLRDAREANRESQIRALLLKVEAMEMEIKALREENLILRKPTTN